MNFNIDDLTNSLNVAQSVLSRDPNRISYDNSVEKEQADDIIARLQKEMEELKDEIRKAGDDTVFAKRTAILSLIISSASVILSIIDMF